MRGPDRIGPGAEKGTGFRASNMATAIAIHTPISTGPDQIRNAGGGDTGNHGRSRTSEKNSGSDVDVERRHAHAASVAPDTSTGSSQSGGRNPTRVGTPSPATASHPIETHAANAAAVAAMRGVGSARLKG